ncbi:MAG: hypothetical protein DRN21_02615 [Thermoplasmata archaeon]|nr:MAG: hypothetical protein DRN07_02690 [Thermoplasmata archaeon]RLF40177.1 MAG: hypothetical protein DRN21_02615 [Thermoplasmata archaeon]
MTDFVMVILFSLAGTGLGAVTGLIPGLHTNNVALLLFMISGIAGTLNLYFCIMIVAAAISHTFLDIVPSTFIGAPEEDTALVVLPAHSMVLKGRGYEAVSLSALSSLAAVAICFALLVPFYAILRGPVGLYGMIENAVPWILICISLIVIVTNRYPLRAALVFLLSGIFGIIALDINTSFLVQSSPVFPALAGLFGASALIHSQQCALPEQNLQECSIRLRKRDIGSGALAGSFVSILPGVSSSIAATLVLSVRREWRDESVISILSAINTSTNFFVLAVLFMFLKARSGFALVIRELIHVNSWKGAILPHPFNLFLAGVIIASCVSYYLTKGVGKFIARNISRISYDMLLKVSLLTVAAMVVVFTGPLGLLIFGVATAIGLLCLDLHVRRSTCMGVLIVPLILWYFT